MRTLVLWDIDHTLVDIRGLSGPIYGSVFTQVTGRAFIRPADMAGRTEWAIIAGTLEIHDLEPNEPLVRRFADALAVAYADHDGDLRARGRVLPGAREALEALSRRPEFRQSALTGNMRSIAALKLAAFGLDTFIDMEIGAYGLDDADRAALVGLAQERALAKYGERFHAGNTVLIGNTPNDVFAGRRGGARVVAVATGASGEDQLKSAGAETVLHDLTDTSAVIRAIEVSGVRRERR